MQRFAVVLAAGKGSRMKSDLYKVLHPVAGKPMVGHVIDQLEGLDLDQIVTIVGHGSEKVKGYIGGRSSYALQDEQLGTGHAVDQARDLLAVQEGTTIVVSGDTPLLTAETIQAGFDYHEQQGAKATVLSAMVEDSFGYGRIVRDAEGEMTYSVEEKDATDEERQIKEINTGTYYFDNQALFESLQDVDNDNQQGEYYLPDVLGILKQAGEKIAAYKMDDVSESLGVNDRIALAKAEQIMRQRINTKHMKNGVSLINPEATYIESEVEIGSDSIIEPNVYLKGQTVIGQKTTIGMNSIIEDSQIGDEVVVTASTIEESLVKNKVTIGPNSHLRPKSTLEDQVHIGNFVEVKNSVVGEGSKAGHLTYLGDADIGKKVNFGCGSIIVNYDGHKKHRTSVGDNAFIGCNVNLVAPVDVAMDSFIGAGSTISKDVPEDALALERGEEHLIENYVSRKREQWEQEDK